MSFALTYRPFSFGDVAGQRLVQMVLNRMIHTREGELLPVPKVPPALLFTGCRGAGKTSTARILAAALNCTGPPRRPCGRCSDCQGVRASHHPDVVEVDAASFGLADDIRRLRETVSYTPASDWRVVILDEAHAMSRAAFNALLKILEEPPERTVFVLVTTEAAKIPPTVSSRCSPFVFRRLLPEVIVTRLAWICQQEGITAEPGLLAAIAEAADGGMRDAVITLDQMATVGITTLAHYQLLTGDSDWAPGLVAAMAATDLAQMFAVLDEVIAQTGDFLYICTRITSCLKDILVLGAGGACAAQGEALAARRVLASQLGAWQVAGAMRVLWDLRRLLPAGQPRSAVEAAVVLCAEKLRPFPKPAYLNGNGHASGNGGSPLTLEQMRNMVGAP